MAILTVFGTMAGGVWMVASALSEIRTTQSSESRIAESRFQSLEKRFDRLEKRQDDIEDRVRKMIESK